MFEKAKVGDRVWSLRHGWGKIVENSTPMSVEYPITVLFSNDFRETYTIGGKVRRNHYTPDLYWDEIKIDPPARPVRIVQKELPVYLNIYKKDSFAGNRVIRCGDVQLVVHQTIDSAQDGALRNDENVTLLRSGLVGKLIFNMEE